MQFHIMPVDRICKFILLCKNRK